MNNKEINSQKDACEISLGFMHPFIVSWQNPLLVTVSSLENRLFTKDRGINKEAFD